MSNLIVPVSDRDHIQGPESALVTLVEYGDYECPYCGEAYPVIKALQERLGPMLRFVFRNFPLRQSHPHAEEAAEAAESAAPQGTFWQMHDLLYENQTDLEEQALLDYAEAVVPDVDRWRENMSHHDFANHVEGDLKGGIRSGVRGTPTFFVNDRRHDGPHDLPALEDAIRRASQSGKRTRGRLLTH